MGILFKWPINNFFYLGNQQHILNKRQPLKNLFTHTEDLWHAEVSILTSKNIYFEKRERAFNLKSFKIVFFLAHNFYISCFHCVLKKYMITWESFFFNFGSNKYWMESSFEQACLYSKKIPWGEDKRTFIKHFPYTISYA